MVDNNNFNCSDRESLLEAPSIWTCNRAEISFLISAWLDFRLNGFSISTVVALVSLVTWWVSVRCAIRFNVTKFINYNKEGMCDLIGEKKTNLCGGPLAPRYIHPCRIVRYILNLCNISCHAVDSILQFLKYKYSSWKYSCTADSMEFSAQCRPKANPKFLGQSIHSAAFKTPLLLSAKQK